VSSINAGAKDDEALFQLRKQHLAQKHQDMKLTDDQARELIKANAKDA
jgi:hypothetical protein